MLFNTVQYFVFLAGVLVAFYAASPSSRKPLLLLASYLFYMSWNPKFIPLLLTLTLVDFMAAILIETVRPDRRKFALILSLVANLGFLAVFKYYNFLAGNLAELLGRPERAFFLAIVLPLGISFHTFQSMSYVIDVYRGDQRAIRNLFDYALFIAFFPQLVAGPIIRAREFFADLFAWRQPTAEALQQGAFLVLLGLTKKMALADQFAKVADAYFRDVNAAPGMLSAWSGTLAFAMQIFFDFSGYTDIAIGCARVLGFHFPLNFARPYLAASIADFWHRWHMSLSRWLRDYLYIPLGGNRHGQLHTYRNLMLTMLLGGLWHGASWNFIIWGGYHGLLLSIGRLVHEARGAVERPPLAGLHPLRVLATFLLVCIGWVFFRATTFADSVSVLRQMFSTQAGVWLLERRHLYFILVSLALSVIEERWNVFHRIMRAPRWAKVGAIAALLLWLEIFAVTDESIPFIYFQF
jgi:D-alanyl-lipoteichoic acid acyltransferase DltB (MBOAT superfamily)